MSEFITDWLASPVGGVGVGTEEERNVVVLRCILQRKYDLRTPEPIHQTADTHYVYYNNSYVQSGMFVRTPTYGWTYKLAALCGA